MKHWFSQALVSLSVAVACAKATDEELLKGGGDDSGGSSGKGATGGTPAFGGTPSFGGGAGRGGASTGGIAGAGKGGVAGTGGTSGAAGASDGGASDGGEGGTDGCSVVGTPPALRVEYKSSMRSVAEDPEGEFHLVNGTSQPIPLRELTFRYWFHSEFTCSETTSQMAVNVVYQELTNPYVVMAPSSVTDRVVDLGTGAPGCDAYFEIGFTMDAGSLAPGQWATVKYYASIPIYETARPKNQANDYSYGACMTAFVYWNKLTLYRNGSLVSGREPGGGGGEGGQGGAPSGGMGGV